MHNPILYTAEHAQAYQEDLRRDARRMAGAPRLQSYRPKRHPLAGLGRILVAAGMALQRRYSHLESSSRHRIDFPVRHAQ